MNVNMEKSRALWQRAAKVMPLGVNSNFRYWGARARAPRNAMWITRSKRISADGRSRQPEWVQDNSHLARASGGVAASHSFTQGARLAVSHSA